MDLLNELDQLTDDKKDTESHDWLPDGTLEDSESTVQKRLFGHGTKPAQRKRLLGIRTITEKSAPQSKRLQFRRPPQNKRPFCNFYGC